MGELFTPTHVLILLPLFVLFFLPTFVAGWRKTKHYWFIAIANLLVGGTGLGWIAALIWAVYDRPHAQDARAAILS